MLMFSWYIFYNCEYIFVLIHLEILMLYSNHILLIESSPDIKTKSKRIEISYVGHHIFIIFLNIYRLKMNIVI